MTNYYNILKFVLNFFSLISLIIIRIKAASSNTIKLAQLFVELILENSVSFTLLDFIESTNFDNIVDRKVDNTDESLDIMENQRNDHLSNKLIYMCLTS
jgi:hypothetical protein